ncbi:MAG: thioredoxin domain-containing protein [Pyrinomonadaceae bacterium]
MTQGQEDIPVTLVEFGNYECTVCRRAYPALRKFRAISATNCGSSFDTFRPRFIQELHPAEAAGAAGAQGKFWEMHDQLFAHGENALDDSHLISYAGKIGIDTVRFEHELAEGTYAASVEANFNRSLYSGISGTPTFYINDVRYTDSVDELLDALIQADTSGRLSQRQHQSGSLIGRLLGRR